jgi:hypothetical protein
MKFGFIAKHRNIWPVAWLCEAMGVSTTPPGVIRQSGISALLSSNARWD